MDLTLDKIRIMTSKEYLENRKEIKQFFTIERPKKLIGCKFKSYNSPIYQRDYYLKNIEQLKQYKKEYYKRRKDELRKLCLLF